MYTQCPACATLFRGMDELAAGVARVRCGLCAQVFDPRARSAESLPAEFLAHVPVPEMPDASQGDAGADVAPTGTDVQAVEEWSAAANEDNGAAGSDEAASGSDTDWHLASALEVELRSGFDSQVPPRATGWWSVGVIAMLGILVAQVFWFERDQLAAYPQLRPWLEGMCAVAGCELPLREDPDRVRLTAGRVTDHPEEEGALVATAVLTNTAGFRQPYPLLKLSLLDQDQNVVGERWFHPGDYLEEPARRRDWQRGMPTRQPLAVRLALRDPGSGTAQYVFTVAR